MKSSIPVGTLLLIGDFWNPFNILTLHDDYTSHVIPVLDDAFKATISQVLRKEAFVFQEGATYVQSSGPRFETQAEIRMMAQYGDVVGMTGANEAELMCELRLPIAMLAMVDNFANGITGALTFGQFKAGQHTNESVVEGALTAILRSLAGVAEAEGKKQTVSLVVHAKWIVPGVPLDHVLEDHSVVVDDGCILKIMPTVEAREKFRGVQETELPNHVL